MKLVIDVKAGTHELRELTKKEKQDQEKALLERQERITAQNIADKKQEIKKLLSESDYTQLEDFPSDQKANWAAWRSSLRALLSDISEDTEIPEKPF